MISSESPRYLVSSGKTIIIVSSDGDVAVDGHEEVKVSANAYKK